MRNVQKQISWFHKNSFLCQQNWNRKTLFHVTKTQSLNTIKKHVSSHDISEYIEKRKISSVIIGKNTTMLSTKKIRLVQTIEVCEKMKNDLTTNRATATTTIFFSGSKPSVPQSDNRQGIWWNQHQMQPSDNQTIVSVHLTVLRASAAA